MVRVGSGVGGQTGWWNPGLGMSVYVRGEAWGAPGLQVQRGMREPVLKLRLHSDPTVF